MSLIDETPALATRPSVTSARYNHYTLFSSHIQMITLIHSQIEPAQGRGDDTAVNVIRLLCKQAWGGFPVVGSVTSDTMPWGNEQPRIYCPDNYWIVAFQVNNMIYDCISTTLLLCEYILVFRCYILVLKVNVSAFIYIYVL